MRTAYLVALVNAETFEIEHIDVFSEPRPSHLLSLRPIVLVTFQGKDYQTACNEMKEWIRQNQSVLKWHLKIPINSVLQD